MLQVVSSLLGALCSKYFLIPFFAGIYIYLKFFVYTYWQRHGVEQETPKVPFSNALSVALGKISMGNYLREIYEKYRNHRFIGIYMFYQPVLLINDPELVRQVLVKDFNKFRDRGLYHNEKADPLTSNLFFLPGEKWRKLRAKLTPTFTSKKLKEMFLLLKETSDHLMKNADSMVKDNDIVEVKDLISRYTTSSISSIVYGIDTTSQTGIVDEFLHYGSLIFDNSPIKNFLAVFANKMLYLLSMPALNQDANKFFSQTFDSMVEQRRRTNIVRKDFLNLLVQLMDNNSLDDTNDTDQDKLSLIQARAQAFIFFLGGFETSSSTMTYLLYEIAQHPDIQEKLHEEIDEFVANGETTYDRLKDELKYLDMVFSETLRKHSSFPMLNRLALEDWQIPNSHVTIKKDTAVVISVSGIHHDPEIYPEPEKFDPSRFSDENVAERSPYVYLPFGYGPRNCIGGRFGILQSKLALLALLRNYKVHICDKTVIPLDYSKRSLLQTPDKVYLRFEKRH